MEWVSSANFKMLLLSMLNDGNLWKLLWSFARWKLQWGILVNGIKLISLNFYCLCHYYSSFLSFGWKFFKFIYLRIHLTTDIKAAKSTSNLSSIFSSPPNYYSALFCWLIAHAIHVFIIVENRKNKFHAINRWHDNHSKFPGEISSLYHQK